MRAKDVLSKSIMHAMVLILLLPPVLSVIVKGSSPVLLLTSRSILLDHGSDSTGKPIRSMYSEDLVNVLIAASLARAERLPVRPPVRTKTSGEQSGALQRRTEP